MREFKSKLGEAESESLLGKYCLKIVVWDVFNSKVVDNEGIPF